MSVWHALALYAAIAFVFSVGFVAGAWWKSVHSGDVS